jgi:hypothetical protein
VLTPSARPAARQRPSCRRRWLLAAAWLCLQPVAGAVAETAGAGANDLASYRKTAEALYAATSADARIFAQAVYNAELRRRVERIFKRGLSNEQLRQLARQTGAEAEYWRRYLQGLAQIEAQRRIPGKLPAREAVPPVENAGAVLPPQPVGGTGDIIPLPDRWRILDTLGRPENIFDPYNTNTLKGDKPIIGNNWFIDLSAIADSLYEPSRVPLAVAPQASARPGSNNTFGRYGRLFASETDLVSLSLIEGDTAFKPPDFELRLTPAFSYNHLAVGELRVVNANPEKGDLRNENFLGLQEGFVDYHLRNVSEYYDFDALRVGIQPFNADFRGFLFQDQEPGIRLYGNRDDNRWQYNIAYFRRVEKDTDSGLNDLGLAWRRDDVVVLNLYRQDFPVPGFTSQVIYTHEDNGEGNELFYDKDGFLVRPLQIGDDQGYDYYVNYLGYNGDGHIGRLNLTVSNYWAFGDLTHNPLGPPGNRGANINAFFAAAEPSVDFDYFRLRLSGLFASGDRHPQGGHATGFDAIFENPQFAGADTSYWIRQSLPFIGGGQVGLNTENGVLADLRSSKGEGQSNFINPGLVLGGIGGDYDILPELRLSGNANYLRFVSTHTLEFLRHQADIPDSIGYDLSVALTYRPLDTQNIVFRLSGAVLLPAPGLKAIYNTAGATQLFGSGNFLYNLSLDMILTF